MSVPATPGRSWPATDTPAERPKSIHALEINRHLIFLAENQPDAAEKGAQSIDENKDQAPGSGSADSPKNAGNKPEDAATRPLKPFKPSQEIAAEQAVDFPVDM